MYQTQKFSVPFKFNLPATTHHLDTGNSWQIPFPLRASSHEAVRHEKTSKDDKNHSRKEYHRNNRYIAVVTF